jgi:hypothetical protein
MCLGGRGGRQPSATEARLRGRPRSVGARRRARCVGEGGELSPRGRPSTEPRAWLAREARRRWRRRRRESGGTVGSARPRLARASSAGSSGTSIMRRAGLRVVGHGDALGAPRHDAVQGGLQEVAVDPVLGCVVGAGEVGRRWRPRRARACGGGRAPRACMRAGGAGSVGELRGVPPARSADQAWRRSSGASARSGQRALWAAGVSPGRSGGSLHAAGARARRASAS